MTTYTIPDTITLSTGEEIVTIIRRHWFGLALEGFLDICIFVAIITSVVVFDSVVLTSEAGTSFTGVVPLGFFLLGFVGLFLWMHFFMSWSDHWLDAWIITNKRVIDIEQYGFFRREVSSFQLDTIQDITYTVSGIVATWLHFGDVRVQTASISQNLIMRQIPFPEDVKEHLTEILSKIKRVSE